MNREQIKKQKEIMYAAKVSDILNKNWSIKGSDNERAFPDLIVTDSDGTFGLEVTEVYSDIEKKGSAKKKHEGFNKHKMRAISRDYYKNCPIPLMVKISGNIDNREKIVSVLTNLAKKLEHFESREVKIENNTKLYIQRLTDDFKSYQRWVHIDDHIGFARHLKAKYLLEIIKGKADKLPKYKTNINDISLLLVIDPLYNSGKTLYDGLQLDSCGFKDIYLLRYPECVQKITVNKKR